MRFIKKFFSIRNGVILGLLINGALVIYGIFLAVYPFKTLEVFGNPIVMNSPVTAGTTLTYQFHYCKYLSVPAKVERTLVGAH